MEKEESKIENISSSDLEKKLGLGVRDACGLKVRTFDCINDMELVSEIRKDVTEEGGSGFIRSDVMNAFYLSIHELIGKCEMYFALHDTVNIAALAVVSPEKDRFLSLLNDKRFDGICEDAEDVFRQKQYRQIKEAYFTDREFVINNMYIQQLKKGSQKKRNWLSYTIGIPVSMFLLLGAAAQIGTYFTAKALKEETRSEIQSTKEEIYSTVNRLEESMQPENMIRRAEDYFKSREGQEYIDSKYTQFKAWWAKENLAADQFDVFWEKKIKPVVEEFNSAESDQRRAKYIVDLLEQEYGLKTTVEEIARIFGKKKND